MVEQVASNLELIVIRWLDKKKIPYNFQTSLAGGFFELGGAVVDFLVEPNLAWRIMGEYYHSGVEKTGEDIIQKEMLGELGYTVVDILGDDLLDPARLEQTMQLALQGVEMLQ